MSNILRFFEETIRPLVAGRATSPIRKPFLLLDECVDNRDVDQAALELFTSGRCAGGTGLWQALRATADGSRFLLAGGVPKGCKVPGLGLPVKGWSWPDTDVVDLLVAHFTTEDRIVLLTENTKRNQGGLWRLVHEEIKPSLEAHGGGRLGLLVLAKRGKATHSAYAKAVLDRLSNGGVERGFSADMLPGAA